MENKDYDCIIIGGGPGGLVSALYLGRFLRKVLLVDAGNPRARWIPKIRNLVGYAKGLTGPQLLNRLRKQVRQYPVDFAYGEAVIRRTRHGFKIRVQSQIFYAKTAILATGLIDVQPHLDNIPDLRSLNVLGYCPICDGYDHSKDKVALFVKNKNCFRKVRFIAALCPRLTVVPTKSVKFSPQFKSWAQDKKVRIVPSHLERLDYQRSSRKLLVYLNGIKAPLKMDFAYVALGVEFDKSAVKHLNGLKRTKEGFIQTSSHQETSIPGLYAVGDCVNALAQVSVAIGQAALAATRIHHDLFFKR